jgi:hypothetical protein
MPTKVVKKIIFAVFVLAFSCAKEIKPYIISHLSNIQKLEEQDHKSCLSLKLSKQDSDINNQFYWRCRLSFAKYRLIPKDSTQKQSQQNLEISDLVTKISLKIANTYDSTLLDANKKMDDGDHKQCLSMGFEIETLDQAKIDDYFSCRKFLIEERNLIPPYGNAQYLKYQNHSYDIGFVIDRRIDEKVKRYNEAKEKYPDCVKYNLNGVNFKKCAIAQDQASQCFLDIAYKRAKKDSEEKILCQKQAYTKFNDELLKDFNERKKNIEQMKKKSAYYNKQSFESIGLDDSQFISKSSAETKKSKEKNKKEILVEKQKKLEEAAKINNENKELYDKFELSKLRQNYIFSCQKEAVAKIEEFVEGVKKRCDDLSKFDLVDE